MPARSMVSAWWPWKLALRGHLSPAAALPAGVARWHRDRPVGDSWLTAARDRGPPTAVTGPTSGKGGVIGFVVLSSFSLIGLGYLPANSAASSVGAGSPG